MSETSSLLARLQDLDSLWDDQDPQGSEARFRDLLAAVRGSEDLDTSYEIELLALIARAQGAQSHLDAAHVSLDEADRLLSTEPRIAPPARIRLALEKGRLHILDRIPSQARAHVAEAWTSAKAAGEVALAVDAAQMMAVIEPQKAQQEWILQAIRIAEGSHQPQAKRSLGHLYTSLGWKFYDLRQFEKSLQAFEKAQDHHMARGSKHDVFVSRWSIGKVLRALNRTQEALAIQQSLLSDSGAGTDASNGGRLFQELAECLHALKRTEEAQPYFERAYHALSKDEWVVDNEAATLKRLKDLGKAK